MKELIRLVIGLCLVNAANLQSQDTVFTSLDTILCSEVADLVYFQTPYDSDLYQALWLDYSTNDTIGVSDSIAVAHPVDSLILVSSPLDPAVSVLVDTIFLSTFIKPAIGFVVPPFECYTGDTISIINQSIFDEENILQDLVVSNAIDFVTNGDTLQILSENGDTVEVNYSYEVPACPDFDVDTVITVGTLFTPVSEFSATRVCFGDSTTISNTSIYDRDSSSFSLRVEGLIDFTSTAEAFTVYLPNNTETRSVFVEITEGTCTTTDTFSIQNKLQPTAAFQSEKQCENELLDITNLSEATLASTTYDFIDIATGQVIIDTLPDGDYTLIGIVDNNNGCVDSVAFDMTVDSVTYVTFENLESQYCERQDISTLSGSEQGGEFTGQFITDFGNGSAQFAPNSPASNIIVQYMYTNTLGCTDSYTEVVDTIYPKPMLVLSGLQEAYCESDPGSELVINQAMTNTSIFAIFKNDTLTATVTDISYFFDPVTHGTYSFENIYTDSNMCSDTIVNTTVVNPLPIVALDSITIIAPTDIIEIGNMVSEETDVQYTWSNGALGSSIEVSLPGIYILTAENIDTGCAESGLARVKFDESNESELISIRIAPNPTPDQLTITLSNAAQDITVRNVFGDVISIAGMDSFSTNSDHMLTLDLSNQLPGYYYIVIPNHGNFLVLKV